MQFLLLLSAILAALTGAAGPRAVPAQPLAAERSVAEVRTTVPAAAVLPAVLAVLYAFARSALPLPRPLAIPRGIAIYTARRRE